MAGDARYQQAAAQLGHDEPIVRTAGIYALEAIVVEWAALGDTAQRDVCIDLLCGYLRSTTGLDHDPTSGLLTPTESERSVRSTVTTVIVRHLGEDKKPGGWSDRPYDFTKAHVVDANFDNVTFQHDVEFEEATFHGSAFFDEVTFQGDSRFLMATFQGNAWFGGTQFQGVASFYRATFHGFALLRAAFHDDATFYGATFRDDTSFYGATFHGDSLFEELHFHGWTSFEDATFRGDARFATTHFLGSVLGLRDDRVTLQDALVLRDNLDDGLRALGASDARRPRHPPGRTLLDEKPF